MSPTRDLKLFRMKVNSPVDASPTIVPMDCHLAGSVIPSSLSEVGPEQPVPRVRAEYAPDHSHRSWTRLHRLPHELSRQHHIHLTGHPFRNFGVLVDNVETHGERILWE